MAFDGAFLYKTTEELRQAYDCHVDKIYQPTRDELVFLLRKKGFVKKLYISVKQGSARIHFTENKYENPAVPPNFCMLLRKYLSSARLIDISQPKFERIAELTIERKTGARGLRSIIEGVLQKYMFEAPSDSSIKKITITENAVDGGDALIEKNSK